MGNKKTKTLSDPDRLSTSPPPELDVSSTSPRFREVAQDFLPSFKKLVEEISTEHVSLKPPTRALPFQTLQPNSSTTNHNVQNSTIPLLLNDPIKQINVAGQSIATYPEEVAGRSCNADFFSVSAFPGGACLTIADGCNWGARPRLAAITACHSFCTQLLNETNKIFCLRDTYDAVMKSIVAAQANIMGTNPDIWSIGCTTLFGSLLFPINSQIDNPASLSWDFFLEMGTFGKLPRDVVVQILQNCSYWDFRNFCSTSKHFRELQKLPATTNYYLTSILLGDVRGFLFKKQQKCVIPILKPALITIDYDCGGRLGPYLGSGKPDLRNLTTGHVQCMTGDMIILLSDGVLDNLGIHFADSFSSIEEGTKLQGENMEVALGKLKVFCLEHQTPEAISKAILDYCLDFTSQIRDFAFNHPNQPIGWQHHSFPGKMDHTTCVVFQVQ